MTGQPVPADASAGATELDAWVRRIELLFTHDADGRLLRVRETDGAVAPRFYLGRSALGNVWRFRAELPPDVVVKLARLAGKERPLQSASDGAQGGLSDPPPPERAEAFRQVLRSHAEVSREYRGPAFGFPATIPSDSELTSAAGRGSSSDLELVRLDASREADRWHMLTPIDEGDRAAPALSGLLTPSPLLPQTDCFAILRAGEVISACWTSRSLSGVGAAAGVRTRASEQGQGLAIRVVAAWARGMRESGTEPQYGTEWTNTASRGVARRLGLIFCGEDFHIV